MRSLLSLGFCVFKFFVYYANSSPNAQVSYLKVMLSHLTAKSFTRSFVSLILLAWILPALVGLSYLVYINMFTLRQAIQMMFSPVLGLFVLFTTIGAVWYFLKFAKPMIAYLANGNDNQQTSDTVLQRIRRFPFHFWSLFLGYLVLAPIFTIESAVVSTHFESHSMDWIQISLVALVVSIIVGLPLFFLLFDLFGRAFGGLITKQIVLTVKTKVFLIGALVPLLIDTVLVQYFWSRTGYFSSESLFVWLALEGLAISGSLIFVRSFGQSLQPLNLMLSNNQPYELADIQHLTPKSTDELGSITAGYKQLIQDLQAQNELLQLSHHAFQDSELDNVENVFLKVIDLCQKAIGGDKIFLILLDPENDNLVCVAQTNEGYNPEGHFRLSRNETSMAVSIFNEGKSQAIANVPEDKSTNPRMIKQFSIRSAIGSPLIVENRVLGVLISMNSRVFRTYTDLDIRLMEGFAREAALTVHAQILNASRQAAEKALSSSEKQYRRMIETSNEGVWTVDREGRITFVNARMATMLGHQVSELKGKCWFDFVDEEMQGLGSNALETIFRGSPVLTDFRFSIANRPEIWTLMSASPITDENGLCIGALGMFSDITERKNAENQVQFLAYHDALTNLPNRALFMDRLTLALTRAVRHNTIGAVMFLDLDRFKTINDSLGHPVGDDLLKLAARRLLDTVRSEDTVARLGGDEFVVLLENLQRSDTYSYLEIQKLAEKLRFELSKPYFIDGGELHITASIGIVTFPMQDESPVDIVREADTAMYRAKAMGRNHVQFYMPEMAKAAHERLLLENQLRGALSRNEFFIQLQPQVRIADGKITSVEALLRWNSPEKGQILPDKFIGLLDETGLISSIGEWVLQSSIKTLIDIRSNPTIPCEDLRISVNISPRQFVQADFVSMIVKTLRNASLDPSALELEITEDIIIHDIDAAINKIKQLKAIGVRFALDDFGTGYSSLSYLKRLPVDILKIDRSFVKDINIDESDRAIVDSIISMAHHLNLDVVAEGVETYDQLEHLKQRNCFAYQGFLYSRPIDSDKFVSLYKNLKTAN